MRPDEQNSYLQAGGVATAALTALSHLVAPGVTVAAGADNVRDPRAYMGLAPAGLRVGDQATILAIEGADPADVTAGGRPRRLTILRGNVVARTPAHPTLSRIPEPLRV